MEKEKKEKSSSKYLAVIRVRGAVNLRMVIIKAFEHLNLYNKNYCAVLEDTPVNRGMIEKVKDYVTWGEISEEMKLELISKRAELYKGPLQDSKKKIVYDKFFEHDGKKYKKYFRLNSPKKGYGKKGVKDFFVKGGALGNREDKINDLLKRMI
jgi:large subunit ribosomal protein L30